MFDVLLHPPQSPERPRFGATVSIAAHLLFVLPFIVGSGEAVRQNEQDQQSIIQLAVRFLLPPDKKGGPPSEPQARWDSRRAGDPRASARPVENGTQALPTVGANARQDVDNAPVPLSEAASAQNAFTLTDVDSAAMRDPESTAPVYPPILQAQGIEGVAVVRFVVDTTGRADPESFTLVEANHPLFSAAVRDALPGMKFRPAAIGTLKVRQLVELPFVFKIIRRVDAAQATKKP